MTLNFGHFSATDSGILLKIFSLEGQILSALNLLYILSIQSLKYVPTVDVLI